MIGILRTLDQKRKLADVVMRYSDEPRRGQRCVVRCGDRDAHGQPGRIGNRRVECWLKQLPAGFM
jgi:hypothetical protein